MNQNQNLFKVYELNSVSIYNNPVISRTHFRQIIRKSHIYDVKHYKNVLLKKISKVK